MKLKIKLLIINLIIILLTTLVIPKTSIATETTNNSSTSTNISNQVTNETNQQSPIEKLNSELTSKSCILIELSTGKVAFEKEANTVMYPASTTKLLTAIIALEKCNLTDNVTITNEMINKVPKSYTTAYLQPGEVITIEQLLNLLLIPSANDAGFSLAIHISGSVENFSNLMNETAKQLGCSNSNFTNPCGIHDNNHYSTAKDLSIIALRALEYPIITEIGAKTSYTLQTSTGNIRDFETTNTLLKQTENSYLEYVTGLKTGYTMPAGSCIVATAKKENMEYLAVVLNSPAPTEEISYRDNDCKMLFEYGFSVYDEITKLDTTFFSFFKGLIISDNIVDTVFRLLLCISVFYAFIVIVLKVIRKKR